MGNDLSSASYHTGIQIDDPETAITFFFYILRVSARGKKTPALAEMITSGPVIKYSTNEVEDATSAHRYRFSG